MEGRHSETGKGRTSSLVTGGLDHPESVFLDPWHNHAFDTAEPCPVCGQALTPGRGWVIRYAGQWVRLRCRECVQEFERSPGRFAAAPVIAPRRT